MSSSPECVRCGDHIHHGLVLCSKCQADFTAELAAIRAENARLTADLAAANERVKEVEEELGGKRDWKLVKSLNERVKELERERDEARAELAIANKALLDELAKWYVYPLTASTVPVPS